MKSKFIPFGKPYIGIDEMRFITKVIKSKWIGSGPITEKFERKFKNYKKSKFALSVNSCTAALHLSLIYCGIKSNDEVITTPMTFVSTINSIILSGAKPILADIDPITFNIDPKTYHYSGKAEWTSVGETSVEGEPKVEFHIWTNSNFGCENDAFSSLISLTSNQLWEVNDQTSKKNKKAKTNNTLNKLFN